MRNTLTFSNPGIRVALWLFESPDFNPNPRISFRCEFLTVGNGLPERCTSEACLETCLPDGTTAVCCLACGSAAVKCGLVEKSSLRYAPDYTLAVSVLP